MDLAPIKNRLAKATPGEWELGYHYHVQGATFCKCFEGYGPLVWQGVREINGVLMQTHVHRRGSHMLFMNDGIYARNDDLGGVYVADTDAMSDADLDLIVHAPADLAALLDKVTELEEENIALRARIDAVKEIGSKHWNAQIKRESKFGRPGSSCVCEVCKIMRALKEGEQG